MRTSVDVTTAPVAGAVRFPAMRQRSIRPTFAQVLPIAAALAVAGCVTTAPRFRTAEDEEGRMASKIREEEMREDDRRFDPTLIKSRLAPTLKPRPAEEAPLPPGLNRDKVLLDIVSLLGVPYTYGGTGKDGLDCSAFTARVYEEATRHPLPRSTADQYEEGTEVVRDELRFGDLVFFNTTGRNPSHVGIYIEDDLFAHASVSYGVTISSLESTYYRNRFIGARRIFR
ncbi:MAG: C40 family peptidase [Bacteroidota bacterium]